MSSNRSCEWHRHCPPARVVPLLCAGKRWHNPGCPECERKAIDDPTIREAPTLQEINIMFRRKRSTPEQQSRLARNVAARRKYMAEHATLPAGSQE